MPCSIKQTKTVNDLMDIVEQLLKKEHQKLGFDPDTFSDKEWIINVLYALNPKHPLLTIEEDIIERELPEG